MLQRWLRCEVFDGEHFCPMCGDVVDIYGDHCLVCSGGGGRAKRSNLLRHSGCHRCVGAGWASELEIPAFYVSGRTSALRQRTGSNDKAPSVPRAAAPQMCVSHAGALARHACRLGLRSDQRLTPRKQV